MSHEPLAGGTLGLKLAGPEKDVLADREGARVQTAARAGCVRPGMNFNAAEIKIESRFGMAANALR